MSRRPRRNNNPAFKAKVSIGAIRGEKTFSELALELELNKDDVQMMTRQLREAVHIKCPNVSLEGEVECDEVYVVAGHKGQPDAVKKRP